jgi:uncharacterized protein (DUF4415 family)
MQMTSEGNNSSVEKEMDAELKRMKRLPRGSFKASPEATDLKNCKVKITTYLDADVLEFFKMRASLANAAPYQTQINNELRKVMEGSSSEVAETERRLLDDTTFLKALKRKLESV